jgi:homoserine kinase
MPSEPFVVVVPASTSNLGSGFDTVSAALSLYLEVSVEESEHPGIHWLSGWDSKEDNILDAALRCTLKKLEKPIPAVSLSMRNPIPLKRGLGSSGAAIVAGIKIAERLAGVQLTPEEILEIAYPLELHPDNLAASLHGGWVLSRVSSGKVRVEKIQSRLDCRFVVAIPDTTVSTQEARAILPDHYELSQVVHNLQRCALLVHALYAGRGDLISEAVDDAVHQPFRANLIPGLSELLKKRDLPDPASRHLLGVAISGSGSCVLGIADDCFEQVGEWMVDQLQKRGTGSTYLVLDLDTRGVRVQPGSKSQI